MRKIFCKTELEESIKQEMQKLHLFCNAYDGTESPLYFSTELNYDKKIPAFYLMYESNELIAFLILSMPVKGEAEVTAYTHPDYRGTGCFKELREKARDICRENGIRKMLYAIDARNKSGQCVCAGKIKQKSMEYSFSEYKMRAKDWPPYVEEEKVCFQLVTSENSGIYREVAAEVLGVEDEIEVFLEAILPAVNRRGYLEYWEGVPVGVCHVSFADEEICIYGLGVLEEYRGKGIGKQFVRYMMREVMRGGKELVIEVDAENERAYRLYRSCGFELVSKTDYYEETLS